MAGGTAYYSGMETLVANLVGKTRRDTFDGREFIVAPLTLIVPGVLNGSKGPLFYPLEEIAKNADAWNGIPLVVDHPQRDGTPVSARNPSVLNGQGIGHLFEARANGKLTAEGWFDIKKVQRVAPGILQSLQDGKPIELSTGLFTTNEPADDGATFNGDPYSFVARDYRPDHLAILPDSVGACSVADGCGVLVNSLPEDLQPGESWERVVADNDCGYKFRVIRNAASNLEGRGVLANAEKVKDEKSSSDQAVFTGFVGRTDKHIHAVTLDAFGNGIAHVINGHIHLVDEFNVQRNDGHTHALRKESLIDSGHKGIQNKREDDMSLSEKQKKEIVDGLIANTCCWEEEDREVLNKFSDAKLVLMRDHDKEEKSRELVANAAKKGFKDPSGNEYVWNDEKGWRVEPKKKSEPEPATNEYTSKEPQTTDEWMKAAPKEVQSAVRNAMSIENREKAHIISQLTAELDDKSKEAVVNRLKNRPLEELQDLALLSPKPVEAVVPVASYLGAATPAGNEQEPLDQEDVLPLPVVNWGEKQAV